MKRWKLPIKGGLGRCRPKAAPGWMTKRRDAAYPDLPFDILHSIFDDRTEGLRAKRLSGKFVRFMQWQEHQ